MKKLFLLSILGVLILSTASLSIAGPSIGAVAPNFNLPDTAGINHQLSGSEFTGKAILIDFWASWWTGCVDELPGLDALQDEYGKTAALRVIAINKQEDAATVKPYARGNSCLFLLDESLSAWNAYQQNGFVPITYVIKASDHTIYNYVEGNFDETTIRSWIEACIGVEEKAQITNCKLEIYPNPFTSVVNIKWAGVSDGEKTNLAVYDLGGNLVKTLTIKATTVEWDRRDNNGLRVTEGVYFLKFSNGETRLTEKLIALK
jgi:thiol-disulfide isomerase/thioredoxin